MFINGQPFLKLREQQFLLGNSRSSYGPYKSITGFSKLGKKICSKERVCSSYARLFYLERN